MLKKNNLFCYHAIASGLVRNIRTLSAYAVILWHSCRVSMAQWPKQITGLITDIQTWWSIEVFRPESMSQDCYLWSSVFYSDLFIKFEDLNFPEVWSLSSPPNQKKLTKCFCTRLTLQRVGMVELPFIDIGLWSPWECHWCPPKMTRGTLFLLYFYIFIHDLMSMRALCFKLMYRQCYLSIDWRWQEQAELLFGFFYGYIFVGAICPTSCLLKMPISGAPQSRAAMTVQQIGFLWGALGAAGRVALT